MSGLEGRIALVTGATTGIGRAVAERLAGGGAEVVVHGRDAVRGAEVVSAIAGSGGKGRFVAADLADARDVERLAEEIAEAVLFLVSGRSGYVNGAVLGVHGGERSLLPG